MNVYLKKKDKKFCLLFKLLYPVKIQHWLIKVRKTICSDRWTEIHKVNGANKPDAVEKNTKTLLCQVISFWDCISLKIALLPAKMGG